MFFLEAEVGIYLFQASQCYIVRPWLQTKVTKIGDLFILEMASVDYNSLKHLASAELQHELQHPAFWRVG